MDLPVFQCLRSLDRRPESTAALADVPQCRLGVRSARACQAIARVGPDGQNGEAHFGIADMGLKMQTGDGRDDGPARGVQVSELDQVVGQGPSLIAQPGGERRSQCAASRSGRFAGLVIRRKIVVGVAGGHGEERRERTAMPAGAWTPTMVSSPGAMNRIGRIIAWPVVFRSRIYDSSNTRAITPFPRT